MRRQLVPLVHAALAGVLILPAAAHAQSAAVTNGPVNMRAGPARDYPLVAQLGPGTPVTVMGCVAGYSWCDVAMPNLRGWVYAGRLNYTYQGAPVPILNYGVTIGLPVVTFSIGSYWGNYYRGRPWYRDQARWAHRPPPRPPAMRPPLGGRPPGGHPPPGARPPVGHAPPGARPPGGRPPQGGRPPGGRPQGGPPQGAHGPGGPRPGGPGGRPQGGGRPPGHGGGDQGRPPQRNN